jgi:tetratricopeptide (TPR) repeat protein
MIWRWKRTARSPVRRPVLGSAEYWSGLQGAARLLARRGDYAEALKVLNLVDLKKLGGSWRGSMLLSRGRTIQAAGRKADALKAYRAVVADESALEPQRRAAAKAAAALESGN